MTTTLPITPEMALDRWCPVCVAAPGVQCFNRRRTVRIHLARYGVRYATDRRR